MSNYFIRKLLSLNGSIMISFEFYSIKNKNILKGILKSIVQFLFYLTAFVLFKILYSTVCTLSFKLFETPTGSLS